MEKKGPEEEKKGGPGSGIPDVLKQHVKEKEKKTGVPVADPKKVEEALNTANEAKTGVDDLNKRCDGLEKTDDDLQKQINDLKNKLGKMVPLYLIPLVITVAALVAAYYSAEVSFNPVRTAMLVAACVVSLIATIALYLKKPN